MFNNLSAAWLRSTFCSSSTCVEVAHVDGMVAIRDSKLTEGPLLKYTAAEWSAFIAGVKAGEFDGFTRIDR